MISDTVIINNLDNSILVFDYLKNLFPDKFIFIIGETSYSPCCPDEVAALHLKSDLIIRIGDSCLSITNQIPVYFLIENLDFIENLVLENIHSNIKSQNIIVKFNNLAILQLQI